MEFKRFLILTCCAVVSVDCAKKSQMAKKVEALESLFRSEISIVHQEVESGQQEREMIVERLNELNETMENVGTLENKSCRMTA